MDLMKIRLRPLRREDYPAIEEIIRKTWKYDTLSKNSKDAGHMGRLYLRSCLIRATFACVAVYEGEVLGIILANSKKDKPKHQIRRNLSQLWAIALLFTTKTGRQIGKFFQRFDQVDRELLKNSPRDFDGEICLFAVKENARGTGVGKRLYSAALSYLKSQRAKSFFLFTDTSCTYQFYEKRGMLRLGEKVVEFQPYTNYKLHMFLYGHCFEPAQEGNS